MADNLGVYVFGTKIDQWQMTVNLDFGILRKCAIQFDQYAVITDVTNRTYASPRSDGRPARRRSRHEARAGRARIGDDDDRRGQPRVLAGRSFGSGPWKRLVVMAVPVRGRRAWFRRGV